jgi:membrane protease YdiL (CAAX protease family)
MIYRTPYLELLILAATVFPVGVVSIFLAPTRSYITVRIEERTLTLYCLILATIVATAGWVDKDAWEVRLAHWHYYALGILCAPICLGIEYVLASFVSWKQTGGFGRGVQLNPRWQVKMASSVKILILCVVACEEVIFRQIWIRHLLALGGTRLSLAIVLSAGIFGLNHIQFGATAVATKLVSGIIYGCLYIASGYSLLVPLLAHGLQNVLVFSLAGRQR